MTLYLGKRRVELRFIGRAHTAGDIVAYVPDANVVSSGDIVEYKSACYCGDGILRIAGDALPLDRVGADALVPGRGDALVGVDTVAENRTHTRLSARSLRAGASARAAHRSRSARRGHCGDAALVRSWPIFEHCQPFNVSRAYDEAQGIDTPRIWTAERDRAMWATLQG
jgi:hypothetical protein